MRILALAVLAAFAVGACDRLPDDLEQLPTEQAIETPRPPIPPGAVPRGAARYAAALAGPGPAATEALIARGRERFAIYCTPCHGLSGRGDGPVTGAGFPPARSFHDGEVRAAPPEHIVRVVTHGFGRMWPLAEQIPPQDRWAIAQYIKALQAAGPEAAP